jgi:hypothetical protein
MSADFPAPNEQHVYPMAPLIRLPLIGLYLALALPLPLQAPLSLRPWLLAALPLGLLLVVAITSERVVLDDHGIRLGHPPWCGRLLRRGWSVPWTQVSSLTPVATSQGGRVFYLRGAASEAHNGSGVAHLLPQRVARFEDFLARFSHFSGVDTRAVTRLTPPWTYRLLAVLTVTLLAGELAAFLALRTPAS